MKTKLLNFLKNLIIILGLVVIVMMLFFTTRSYAVSQTVTVGQVMRNSISTWYNFIKEICITVYLIVYLLVCLKLLSDRTPEKNTIVKESIKHFIVMFAVLLFLHYIMIAVILLNQRGVSFAESIGTKLSGVDMKSDEYDLYETALSKAYEISSVPGFIGLLMYLLLVFY